MSRNKKQSEPVKEEEDKDMDTAIMVFAHYIGIDLDQEGALIWIAEEAFDNLPEGWEVGLGDGEHAGIPFFYNSKTGESDWKHPDEQYYMKKVKKERQVLQEKNNKKVKGKSKSKDRDREKSGGESDHEVDREREDARLKIETDLPESSNYGGNKSGANTGNKSASNQNKEKDSSHSGDRNYGDERQRREITEIQEIEDLEDFDDGPSQLRKGEGKRKEETAPAAKTQNKQRPAFGMTEEDFLDEPVENGTKERFALHQQNQNLNQNKIHDSMDRTAKSSLQAKTGITDTSKSTNPVSRLDESDWSTARELHHENRSKNRNIHDGEGRGNDRHKLQDFDEYSIAQTRNRNTRDQSPRQDLKVSNNQNNGKGGIEWDRDRRKERYEDVHDENLSKDSGKNNNALSKSVLSPNSRGGSSANVEILEREVQRLNEQLLAARVDYERLRDEITDQRQKFTQETLIHKDEIRSLEGKLHDERRENKILTDKLTQQYLEFQTKNRELEEAQEMKMKEVSRKIKQEQEDSYREKLKLLERKNLEDADRLQTEIASSKRKYDDLQREFDLLKRKSFYSKEETQTQFLQDLQEWKDKYYRLEEDFLSLQNVEMKKALEELSLARQKHSIALQEIEKLSLENEHLKQHQKTATEDITIKQTAFLQSLERMTKLDTDIAAYKAEIDILQKQNQKLDLENRKMKSVQTMVNDQSSSNETAIRRVKIQSQSEISRLNSRVLELEALNDVFKDQIDKQLRQEGQELKTLQLRNYALESENQRFKEKAFEMALKEEELNIRIRSQEKEMLQLQETVYKRDKLLAEERNCKEAMQSSIQQIRRDYDHEQSQLQARIQDMEQSNGLMKKKYEDDLASIQRETMKQLPKLIQQSVDRYQHHFHHIIQQKEYALNQHYQRLLAEREKEIATINYYYQEKEMKWKLALKEEALQKEHHRARCKDLLQERESLENMLHEKRKQLQYGDSLVEPIGNHHGLSRMFSDQQPLQMNQQLQGHQRQSRSNSPLRQEKSNSPYNAISTTPNLSAVTNDMSAATAPAVLFTKGTASTVATSDSLTKEAIELLNQQLIEMKQQITETLQSQFSSFNFTTASTSANKENVFSKEREMSSSSQPPPSTLVTSLEAFPLSTISKQRTLFNERQEKQYQGTASRRSDRKDLEQSMLLDDESALFLSPQRKGISYPSTSAATLRSGMLSIGSAPITETRHVAFGDEREDIEEEVQDERQIPFTKRILRNHYSVKPAGKEIAAVDPLQSNSYSSMPNSTAQPVSSQLEEGDDELSRARLRQGNMPFSNNSLDVYRQTYGVNRAATPKMSNVANSSSLLNSSIELLDEVPSFDELRDGGYYEGYWKAKYSKYR